MNLIHKAPFILIILIAGWLILGGFENMFFGFKDSYLEVILGVIVLVFVFVYFKFIK